MEALATTSAWPEHLYTAAWITTGLAAAAFVLLPIMNRGVVRAVLVVAVSVACALWHILLRPTIHNPAEHLAWSFALLSAAWAFAIAAVESWRRVRAHSSENVASVLQTARLAAMLFGVVSGVILGVLLTMQSAITLAELINGGPGVRSLHQTFTRDGLWSIISLFAAAVVALRTTRDTRLTVCVFLLGVMGIAWAGLLCDAYTLTERGGYVRTGATLWILVAEAVWLFTVTLITYYVDAGWVAPIPHSKVPRPVWNEYGETAVGSQNFPSRRGLRLCCDLLGVIFSLAICYHLLVPYSAAVGGLRLTGFMCLASALLVALSAGVWLRRSWSSLTAEVVLGHASLAICGASSVVALNPRVPLRDQYPVLFTALMIGFCLAAGACGWLALHGYARRLAEGRQSGTIPRMASVARRFAFINVTIAFLVGVVMTVWPRLPTVATMDDSLGRVTGGLTANLLLLLVVLWCARRLRQPAFHIMTVLAVLLSGGFLLVRVLPFSSFVG